MCFYGGFATLIVYINNFSFLSNVDLKISDFKLSNIFSIIKNLFYNFKENYKMLIHGNGKSNLEKTKINNIKSKSAKDNILHMVVSEDKKSSTGSKVIKNILTGMFKHKSNGSLDSSEDMSGKDRSLTESQKRDISRQDKILLDKLEKDKSICHDVKNTLEKDSSSKDKYREVMNKILDDNAVSSSNSFTRESVDVISHYVDRMNDVLENKTLHSYDKKVLIDTHRKNLYEKLITRSSNYLVELEDKLKMEQSKIDVTKKKRN